MVAKQIFDMYHKFPDNVRMSSTCLVAAYSNSNRPDTQSHKISHMLRHTEVKERKSVASSAIWARDKYCCDVYVVRVHTSPGMVAESA